MANRLPETLEDLIPHKGDMCLLERVLEWDSNNILLETGTHRSMSNPLRNRGRLRSIHMCEYGAQASAVHGGLLAKAQGRVAAPGLLVSLRDVRLERDYVEGLAGSLHVRATLLYATTGSWQYSFSVAHEGVELATGRVAVMERR